MKPVDPRLLRHARATRGFLAASVLLGLAGALLLVAQGVLLAGLVVDAFQQHRGVHALLTPLVLLALVGAGRALVAWLTELAAHRAGAAVKSQLRAALLERATALGPGWLSEQRRGELATLATRGVDALDDYFARYLPQLALAVIVPGVLLAVILRADWLSALTIAVALPLIPLFMVLIGLSTQKKMDSQWRTLSRLSHHFLDVVAGLPTLKVFGRAKAQARTIRRVTDDYRAGTMRTLRVAFVSSYALELLSTLSVAMVAVSIGLRLVDGKLSLYLGLLVLVLAPDVFTPIRQVGTHYHASVEGLSAAAEIFEVLETPLPVPGARPVPGGAAAAPVVVTGLTVTHPGRDLPALRGLSLTLRPGRVTALTGPSGAGKSTLLSVLLGFTVPDAGSVEVGGVPLPELDPADWHRQIAWLPQQPALFAGTVADNVRLARPDADDAAVRAALRQAEALDFVELLPGGIDAGLGEGGRGLSGGQRQRVALARVFLADRPLVLLDEPTANLDGESEAAIVRAIERLADGRTVVLTAHRPALLALADEVHRIPLPDAPAADADAAPAVLVGAAVRPRPAPAPAPAEEPVEVRVRDTRPRLGSSAVLGTLALGCSVALLALSGWLIARASQQPPVLYLMMAVTGVRAFGLGRSAFRYAERLVSHNAVLRALGALRTSVYVRLERLAPSALPFRSGDLLSRLVADVDAMQDHYLRYRLPLYSGIAVSLLTSVAVFLLLPSAGLLLALGLLLAGAGVPALAVLLSRRAEQRQAPTRGRMTTEVVDVLTATAELTVAGALPARLARLRGTDAELRRLAGRSAATAGIGSGLVVLLTGLTVTGCAAAGIAATAAHGIHGVLLAVLVLTPLAAFEAVAGLPMAAQIRQRGLRAAQRVAEVTGAPEPVREPAEPLPLPADPFPIRARGLTATWPGREDAALTGVDLDLTAGRRIAVVGPSGSGKTTLAMLLLRFLEPGAGGITLGGVDATRLDGDAVRRVVGLCAQDAHVFDSSLRENLRLARPDCAEPDLWAALAAARLADWAHGLPQGLDTMVGEHGARLSGGQRQRLALARALLADFPALILDEPAEHLDLATADALTADLLAATRGRTTLLITHRLASLADRDAVDEILVLDAGRVAQRGTWRELVDAEGPLRRMWQREQEADARLLVTVSS
jgi:ATP-binding cassette subfamily C protein CydCD